MPGLFASGAFTGFGPHTLQPELTLPLTAIAGSRPAVLKRKLRTLCPPRPGVYGMVDPRGELIYVGKSKCLRARLLSYFRPGSRDPKAGDIVRETCCVVWEPARCEFGALLRELELIRRWRPRYNVAGQPHRRRRTFLCLGRRPAPYAYLSAKPAGAMIGCYGPLSAGPKAREAARRLNDWFKLRDCPQVERMEFRDQQELFPMLRPPGCIRQDIGTCLGPCAAGCTRDEYEDAIRQTVAFLDGRDRTPLEALHDQMQQASADLQFERAAALRDKLAPLEWLYDRLTFLRRARACSGVYPPVLHEGPPVWYVIHRGFVRAVADPSRQGLREELADLFADRPTPLAPAQREQVEGLVLVAGWFRKHAVERHRLLTPADAMAKAIPRDSVLPEIAKGREEPLAPQRGKRG